MTPELGRLQQLARSREICALGLGARLSLNIPTRSEIKASRDVEGPARNKKSITQEERHKSAEKTECLTAQ